VSVDDDLRAAFLTSSLSDEQRAELVAAGAERTFASGDDLFREGEPADVLWILLAGEIELTRRLGHEHAVVATMTTPGQWAGGLEAWGGPGEHSVYRASGRAVTDGRCFLVPSAELAAMVSRWSPFATHMITGVYQTIRSIDALARERRSLAALGELAARLAHEINNPASAALREVESLRDTAGYMLAALVELAELGILAEDFLALDRLRVELEQRPRVDGGALAVADREEALGTWMEDRDVELAWRMAPVLAVPGADREWLDTLASTTRPEALEPSLRWVSATLAMSAQLSELADATSRVANLVADVKDYSQVDRASLQRTLVRDGIESTLAILRPTLADVEVVLDFDDAEPRIDAEPAALNQVWSNLIENAVDAMEGSGTLRIATRVEGEHLVVEFTDSGPGMPPEVRSRVFEPFFTTKDVGKGTGLGLDISRRIVVDRHHGDIDFDSGPGATTARVVLPLDRLPRALVDGGA
jgi:signal transduction histidine kinase